MLVLGRSVVMNRALAISIGGSRRDHLSIATGAANVRSSIGATLLAQLLGKRSLLRSYATLIGARSIDRSSLRDWHNCIPTPIRINVTDY